jgi:hypothetical protein
MSKAFWNGFRDGYLKGSIVGIPFALGLVVGWAFAVYFHPYEECKRMYNAPEDITECVWIKENP